MKLKELDEIKNDVVQRISHELKTPQKLYIEGVET